MKRILVPTDFSPNAQSALRVAVDIASRVSGTIILYHVYIPLESTPLYDKEEFRQRNTAMETILQKRLQRLKKKVLKDTNDVNISTQVGHSPLKDNITSFAEKNLIDLIVMGTKGSSGIKKVLVGSVAAKVAQKTKVPVLLVPEKFEGGELGQIAFASDYDPSDEQALSFTLAFAKLYKAPVAVVHIFSLNLSERKREKEINDFDSYAYYMQRKFDKDKLRFQLLEATPGHDKAETLYKDVPYKLLAMVRSSKSPFQKIFSGSFTKNMAHMAKRPILIIPPKEFPAESSGKKEKKETESKNNISGKIEVKRIKQKVTK